MSGGWFFPLKFSKSHETVISNIHFFALTVYKTLFDVNAMSTAEIEAPLAPTRARYKTNNCVKNVKWTKSEDELLIKIMSQKDRPNYSKMVDSFSGKTGQQIAERWDKVLNPNLVKGSWTRHEDEIIIQYVQENGTRNWRNLCSLLPGRIGKQCRERWRNHLDPSINHSPWTEEEDELLIKLHREYGNKWVTISRMMKNRSDNAIKNRWNSTLKKKELDITVNEIGYPRTIVNQPEFEKPEIDQMHIETSDQSPMSTPKLLTVISTSPLAARDRRIGFFSPIFNKQNNTKDRPISLTENRNALLEMIPQAANAINPVKEENSNQ